MNFSDLTTEQIRLVFVVYITSIIPLILIPILHYKKIIPLWTIIIYLITILFCAFGWELWFTYGWINGDSVNIRRAPILSAMIPLHINWFLNSLADSGTICLGGLYLVWRIMKRDSKIFYKWNWKCFFILLIICISQNILVEMFLYYDQLSVGKSLSWAPLSPLGSWVNPVLFSINDRTIYFQNQVPWLFMTPIFYFLVIFSNSNKGYYLCSWRKKRL